MRPRALFDMLLIDARPLLEKTPGGVSLFTRTVIEGLAERAHKPFVVFSNAAKISAPSFPRHHALVEHRTRIPNKLLNLSIAAFGYPTLDARIAPDRPHTVFAPNINFTSLKPSTRLILTVHDLTFELFPEFYSLKSRAWHRLVNPRKLCARADMIIAVSKNTRADLIEIYRVPEEKIAVIYPGIGGAYVKQKNGGDEMRAGNEGYLHPSFNLPLPYILYLGPLEPRKNVLGLIRAFEMIADSHHEMKLVIAGAEGYGAERIRTAARASSAASRIIYRGLVADEEKWTLLRHASLFVYPSFYEGFGFPPLEAMAAGCPVVASYAGSLGEVLRDAALLVDPVRPHELRDAMDLVLRDAALRTYLRQRGFERVKQFRWEETVEKIAKILRLD